MSGIAPDKLAKFFLFRDLQEDELQQVSQILRIEEVDSGTDIISENDTGSDLFLLEDGIVDISKTLTIITSRREFGAMERSFVRLTGADYCFFGEMALFGNKERSATVRAVTKCRLLAVRDTDFFALCERNPRIGHIVMTNIAVILSEHLRKANTDILKLTTALSLALSG
jgi:CRP-like cAMP-binding protein